MPKIQINDSKQSANPASFNMAIRYALHHGSLISAVSGAVSLSYKNIQACIKGTMYRIPNSIYGVDFTQYLKPPSSIVASGYISAVLQTYNEHFRFSSKGICFSQRQIINPFKKYKLNELYRETDSTFVVRSYPNLLWKIYNYGTKEVKYEYLIFFSDTAKTRIFSVEQNDKTLANTINDINKRLEVSISAGMTTAPRLKI